ncbi:polysaccharide biosynthesis tyrosine autokinase [Micromonospora sp. DPT]|uniref:polysaccharide biosynthesis tyrosine autokinase n=1 Tax=Micromonospora sp. DPT TaxID=3142975 RepID=UPI00320940ED
MTIAEGMAAIRARWHILISVVVVAVAAAAAFSWLQEPVYQARVQLFVSTSGKSGGNSELNQGGIFSQQRVKSYADIIGTPIVTQPVIDRLQLPYSPDELAERITASTPNGSVLLDIEVEDTSAERSQEIANAIAEEVPAVIDKIEAPVSGGESPVKVSVTRSATLPTDPVRPRPVLNLGLGLLAGLAVGMAAAIARHNLDRTIRTKNAAAQAANAAVLGTVADQAKLKTGLIADEKATPRAESFRQLRTNIRFLSVDRRLSSFVVTGSLPDEGKTTTAANIAIALAQTGQPVVLMDGDLRRPALADIFALPNGVGLTNVLLGELPVNQALQHWRPDIPLYVLVSGPRPPNPSELLATHRLRKVIESLEASGMTVVIDSPPLLPVTDATVIARVTGGAIVVTRAGHTRTDQLASAVEGLRAVGATVLGVVVNRLKGNKETTHSKYYDLPSQGRARASR